MSQKSFKTFLYLSLTQDLLSIIIYFILIELKVVAMKLQGPQNEVFYESESNQRESFEKMISLSSKPHRRPKEKIASRKMESKQAGLMNKKDQSLKKHKQISYIKEYQNNKNSLESPPTDDKIFQDEQNQDINGSEPHSVCFYGIPTTLFILNKDMPAKEQEKPEYEENFDEGKKFSGEDKIINKKKENSNTKNLLQFFWNMLKNKLNIFLQTDQKTQFSIWFRKKQKLPASMLLITELYQFKEIQHFLMTLFQTKFFHRALMLSSTKIQSKKIFFKNLRNLQRSFFNKKLDHIH